MADPTRPPTSVCEELDGKPHHHVRRFQIIAAITDVAIKGRVTISVSMTFAPIVLATRNGKIRKATKLNVAAMPTAAIGDRTLVETTVAIEFAESWKPFMKSKIRTRAMRKYRKVISGKSRFTI
jgi:hypothetical protein